MSVQRTQATPASVRILAPEDIVEDFAASEWLKASLVTALERDPVDAANDAALLAEVLAAHMQQIFRGSAVADPK